MIERFFDYKPEVLALDQKAMELCAPYFRQAEEIRDYNQLKMLRAFADNQMSATDMLGTTGYGLWDTGRAKLEQIFAQAMGCEDALVRSQFMSGTHTLAVPSLDCCAPATPCWPLPPALRHPGGCDRHRRQGQGDRHPDRLRHPLRGGALGADLFPTTRPLRRRLPGQGLPYPAQPGLYAAQRV